MSSVEIDIILETAKVMVKALNTDTYEIRRVLNCAVWIKMRLALAESRRPCIWTCDTMRYFIRTGVVHRV